MRKKKKRKVNDEFEDEFLDEGAMPSAPPYASTAREAQGLRADDHTVILEVPGMTASIMRCPRCRAFINSKVESCQFCGFVVRERAEKDDFVT